MMEEIEASRWEKRTQHELMKTYFSDHRITRYHHEFKIPILKFRNPQSPHAAGSVSADFVVDFESHYEIIECKGDSHPMSLATAFGQVATYRALMETYSIFPENARKERRPRLGLCLTTGYNHKNCQWTVDHNKLLKTLEEFANEKISLYLACPKSPQYVRFSDLTRHRLGPLPASLSEHYPPASRTIVRHPFGGNPATAG